jgi:phosphoenolpyruvate carboxylase
VFDKIAAEHQRSINAHKLSTGQDNLVQRGILLTMNGLASALRNSG